MGRAAIVQHAKRVGKKENKLLLSKSTLFEVKEE